MRARATAEDLLLGLWRRISLGDGTLEVEGDRSVVDRWAELLPTA